MTKYGTTCTSMHHPENKADLLSKETEPEELPQRDRPDKHCAAVILDGSVVLRFLRPPPDCSNIETYVRDVVKPYIESYFL